MAAELKSHVLLREEKGFLGIPFKRLLLAGVGGGLVYTLGKIALPDWGQGSVIIAVLLLFALYFTWKYLRRRHLLKELSSKGITPEELKRKIDDSEEIDIIDVRHPLEFEADPYAIPGARYVPLENLERSSVLPSAREIVTYCS